MWFVSLSLAAPTLHAPSLSTAPEARVESVAMVASIPGRATSADLTSRVRGTVQLSGRLQLEGLVGHRRTVYAGPRAAYDEPEALARLGWVAHRWAHGRIGLHVGFGTGLQVGLTAAWTFDDSRIGYDLALPVAGRIDWFAGPRWGAPNGGPELRLDLTRTLPEAGAAMALDGAGVHRVRIALVGSMPTVGYQLCARRFRGSLSVGSVVVASAAQLALGGVL